ncbi:MAG: HAD-IC family P-type ATPase [Acidobacteriota bacterium]|nr:HAD-IC family P-type ATPase [Acidobacteriota bacterium]
MLTVFNVIIAAFGIVTLVFGDAQDALFLGVIVANACIGVTQEVRAKRALDRLSLLVAPQATVTRDGAVRLIPVEQVVVGDLLSLEPGDQVVADGTLLSSMDLRLDESVLTGESEAVGRIAGDRIRSGAFVVEGSGDFRVEAVGAESFAMRVTGEARSFRHPRSPLERAVNRLLYVLVTLVLVLGTVLGYALYHRHVPLHVAVATATAGVVTLIPEGLMVLVSLTYAVAAVRMSRRGVLAQQLNAIESLAAVDTICIDKTGTLTEPRLRVVEVLPAASDSADLLDEALYALVACSPVRNLTLEAITARYPAQPRAALSAVPFSSRRGWSAVQVAEGSFYLGAPERLVAGELQQLARDRQADGRRVLAVAAGRGALVSDVDDAPPAGLRALGLVVLAEQLRPGIGDTVAFLLDQDVEIKVLSGDAPGTVATIARDVGIPMSVVVDGLEIPDEPDARLRFACQVSAVGRISPEGKRDLVRALSDAGRYVAMVGDGVNDVPALKSARLAIAQGSGTQMARAVSDLVLTDGDFACIPALVKEGRQALRNLQRVTKLYVTKSAFAAFLILTIGISSDAYPLLPRHLSLAASLTIGIPTFFLALAPSRGDWRPTGFARAVARFAVPAGVVTGTGVIAAYLFALHDLNLSVPQARTVALSTLVATGLYLVLALESGGSKVRIGTVGTMCGAMALIYVAALLLPATQRFFQLSSLTPGMIATSVLASGFSMTTLTACGFSVGMGADHPSR